LGIEVTDNLDLSAKRHWVFWGTVEPIPDPVRLEGDFLLKNGRRDSSRPIGRETSRITLSSIRTVAVGFLEVHPP
jgi:hypothetical protein